MSYSRYSQDPYFKMLKQAERKAIGYGLIAAITLIIAMIIAHAKNAGAGQFASVVEQVHYVVGLVLLCVCGVSSVLSLWFIGRYAYFIKWPERFDYHTYS